MAQLRTIPVGLIAPSPDNTRLFDRTDKEEKISLDELAASIRELGLQQPPKVRPNYVYPCGHNVEVKDAKIWNILYDYQTGLLATQQGLSTVKGQSHGQRVSEADDIKYSSVKEKRTTGRHSQGGSGIHGASEQPNTPSQHSTVEATTSTTGALPLAVKSIIFSLPACPTCTSSAYVLKGASTISPQESSPAPSGQPLKTPLSLPTLTGPMSGLPQHSSELPQGFGIDVSDLRTTDSDGANDLLVKSIVRCNFVLVYGERRLRAVRDILKLNTITVLVDDDLASDAASAATVVENLQRRDLHPMDESRGIAILRQQGTSVKDIARRLGRREDWIKERLKLRDLPTEAQDLYRRAERMTLHQALALHDYTHGGRDNKGFPTLIVALATGMAEGSNPNGSLTVIAGTMPELAVPIQHAYHDGGGRWGGNYFDTHAICTKCPFAAYRPGYYDGVGHCLMPLHYQELQRKGKEKYDVAQATAAAASSSPALVGAVAGSAGPTPEPQKTAAQKGKETRQRHKGQTAAYYPNVQAIERAIDMIPAVDTVDVAVLCAYTLTTDHVDRQAVEQVMTRHALKSFTSPSSTPGRAEIERLRSFDGVDLVRYTLEALLLTQAMRARDYDPGNSPSDPVLAMYLPGQAVLTPPAAEVAAPLGDTGNDKGEDLVDVQGEQVINDEGEGAA